MHNSAGSEIDENIRNSASAIITIGMVIFAALAASV
jgi:hypothetical protein